MSKEQGEHALKIAQMSQSTQIILNKKGPKGSLGSFMEGFFVDRTSMKILG